MEISPFSIKKFPVREVLFESLRNTFSGFIFVYVIYTK